MSLKNTQVAIYWVSPNGVKYSKIYKNLDQAEQARSWLIKQNIDPANIELAVVMIDNTVKEENGRS
ncbi:MAG: hypothetical protein Q4A21_02245 [bacterium]|nr:hypothetical protein [bacterium]